MCSIILDSLSGQCCQSYICLNVCVKFFHLLISVLYVVNWNRLISFDFPVHLLFLQQIFNLLFNPSTELNYFKNYVYYWMFYLCFQIFLMFLSHFPSCFYFLFYVFKQFKHIICSWASYLFLYNSITITIWLKMIHIYYLTVYIGKESGPSFAGSSARL